MGDMVMSVQGQENVPAGVRTRSRACLECHRQFSPAREWHKYCSDACRAEWHRKVSPGVFIPAQARLDFTPAASELAQALRNRETRAQKMLARLRMGPASTFDLMMLGGAGFSSRLKELRRAGHDIQVEGGPERFVYTLKGK